MITKMNPEEFASYLDGCDDLCSQLLRRRIKYIIEEMKADKRPSEPSIEYRSSRDQSITYTQRVISNYLTIGADLGSAQIIRKNRLASKEAIKVMQRDDMNDWSQQLTNEHPIPLIRFWNELKCLAKGRENRELYKFFALTRMVTVTKIEDKEMNDRGYKMSGTIKQRYAHIEIRELKQSPVEEKKNIEFNDDPTDKIADFDSLT